MVVMAIVLSIIRTHYVTNNVNDVSMVWGFLSFIIYKIEGEWLHSLVGSFVSFVVVWLLFTLSNYLQESFFLRTFVLVVSMVVMLLVLSYFLI